MSPKTGVGFFALFRFLIVVLLTGIWIGIVFLLCNRVFHVTFSESLLDVPSIFLNALQFIPRIGDFLGLLTAGFGIDAVVPDSYRADLLFEVLYTLMLAFQFACMNQVVHRVMQMLNILNGSNSLLDKMVYVLNTLTVILASILSTNLLCSVPGAQLLGTHYVPITSIVILGLFFFTLLCARKQKFLNAIGNLLISLLSVALIYLMVMSGYCLSNSVYMTTFELLSSVICFITSLLAVTVLGAKFFSNSFIA